MARRLALGGDVTVFTGKSELRQGIKTAVLQRMHEVRLGEPTSQRRQGGGFEEVEEFAFDPLLRGPSRGCLLFQMQPHQSIVVDPKVLAASTRRTA